VAIIIIMAEQRKAVIKNADMSEAMQQDAVDVASVALSKYNIEKVRNVLEYFCDGTHPWLSRCAQCLTFLPLPLQDVAAYIKKEFDKKYNPTWYVTLFCLQFLDPPFVTDDDDILMILIIYLFIYFIYYCFMFKGM
jgi:dynein light chain LC8-type